MLKTLEDDATSMLIAKRIGSRPTYLIIVNSKKDRFKTYIFDNPIMPKISNIPYLRILTNMI